MLLLYPWEDVKLNWWLVYIVRCSGEQPLTPQPLLEVIYQLLQNMIIGNNNHLPGRYFLHAFLWVRVLHQEFLGKNGFFKALHTNWMLKYRKSNLFWLQNGKGMLLFCNPNEKNHAVYMQGFSLKSACHLWYWFETSFLILLTYTHFTDMLQLVLPSPLNDI